MGYYTDFVLSKFDGNEFSEAEVVAIEDLSVFDYVHSGGASVRDTWYDWERDMRFLSEDFPDTLFLLHGHGEGEDDQWDAYFQNGKAQICRAEISYQGYDQEAME